jgi:hypothetical protein
VEEHRAVGVKAMSHGSCSPFMTTVRVSFGAGSDVAAAAAIALKTSGRATMQLDSRLPIDPFILRSTFFIVHS